MRLHVIRRDAPRAQRKLIYTARGWLTTAPASQFYTAVLRVVTIPIQAAKLIICNHHKVNDDHRA